MQPRNPCDVIEQILKHVPPEKTALHAELNKIRSDGFYVPPEGDKITWKKLGTCLESWLNVPPIHDWEKTIHNIIQNKQ